MSVVKTVDLALPLVTTAFCERSSSSTSFIAVKKQDSSQPYIGTAIAELLGLRTETYPFEVKERRWKLGLKPVGGLVDLRTFASPALALQVKQKMLA